ncbi:MAG: YraN family protein [Sphingomonadales bacterium]|nr:YraN family protein [Sphingomonadales bacterium]
MKGQLKAHKKGLRAERLAVWLLRFKGYRIREVRYATPVGEVDIIATRGSLLALIEVKARQTMDDAAYAITARQKQRIERAARLWTQKNGGDQAWRMRFDAVLVAQGTFPRHMKGAWRPTA